MEKFPQSTWKSVKTFFFFYDFHILYSGGARSYFTSGLASMVFSGLDKLGKAKQKKKIQQNKI